MRFKLTVAAAVAVMTGLIVAGLAIGSSNRSTPSHMHDMAGMAAQSTTAADLRVLLDRQLGQHAALAMNATNCRGHWLEGLPGRREVARPELGRALEVDRVGLRREGRQHVPERQVHVA